MLTTLKDHLARFCKARHDIQFCLAPPLFQATPTWYFESLPWIANQFSSRFSSDRPSNLHLLPSLICQDLMANGFQLTPVAGLHYVLHLFDQSVATLGTLQLPQEDQLVSVREAGRSHDDRISYLEQGHVHLSHRLNLKTAADAEFSDWVRNRNDEDWFTIRGLPRLSPDLNSQEWQVEAKRQVRDLIRLILQVNKANLSYAILVVSNPVRFRTTGPTIYNVQLNSVEASKRIRELFSGFF